MYQILYVSFLSDGLDADDVINSVKEVSERKNKKFNITGKLIYSHNAFIQLLEGEKINVEVAYAIIKNDPRHFRSTILTEQESTERAFPDWSMSFNRVHNIDLLALNKILEINKITDKNKLSKKEIINCFDELEKAFNLS